MELEIMRARRAERRALAHAREMEALAFWAFAAMALAMFALAGTVDFYTLG